ADEANEVGALLEEPERGAHDALDLRPPFAHALRRLVDEAEPIGERLEEHRAVERFLGREVVEQAGAADADLLGDLRQARAGVPVLREPLSGHLEDVFLGGPNYGFCRGVFRWQGHVAAKARAPDGGY